VQSLSPRSLQNCFTDNPLRSCAASHSRHCSLLVVALSSLMASVMKPICNPDQPLGRAVYRTFAMIEHPAAANVERHPSVGAELGSLEGGWSITSPTTIGHVFAYSICTPVSISDLIHHHQRRQMSVDWLAANDNRPSGIGRQRSRVMVLGQGVWYR
jgi:hypothetical protein